MIDVRGQPNIGHITHISLTHSPEDLGPMRIYDISLKRPIFKLKRTVRKRLDRKDRAGQRRRHSTPLYIWITVVAYMVLVGLSLMKVEQNQKGRARTEKAPRPKIASLKDNAQ